MSDILVSIIIPVYNGEKYLKEAINSALSQTHEKIEVIVINDGSIDQTEKIALSFGKKIRYYKKNNGGVSTALNLGIKKMKGQYFSWLSHDDVYYPEKIEEQLKFINLNYNYNDNIILYTDYEIINQESEHVTNVTWNHDELTKKPEYGLLRCKINGISLLIPKKAFFDVGLFDENLRCTQDYEKWFEMIENGYSFVHLPKILVKTRVHDEQVTNTSSRFEFEGNLLWIKLIDFPTRETKENLEGSEYLYYLKTLEFLKTTPYTEAIIFCEQKVKELSHKKNVIYRASTIYRELGIKILFERIYNYIKKKIRLIIKTNRYTELDNKIKILETKNLELENILKNTVLDFSKQNNNLITHSLKLNEQISYKLYEIVNFLSIHRYEEKMKYFKTDKDFNPMVSIIIPVYNGSNYMKSAIDSALNQTYKNIEIILVNDGSDDNSETEKIALSYGEKIRYFKKTNGGVSSALNLGIKHMKGEYFAWLSHDDIFKKYHIEKHIEYLKGQVDRNIITYTNLEIIDKNGILNYDMTIQFGLYGFNYFASLNNPEYALLMGEINGDSVLIPKEAFHKVGLFNENQRITQERDMWSRLMTLYKFVLIPYITTSLRVHDSQVSSKVSNIIELSNEKQKAIINNIPIEKILELEYTEMDFYIKLRKHYTLMERTALVDFLDDKIKNVEKNKEDRQKKTLNE